MWFLQRIQQRLKPFSCNYRQHIHAKGKMVHSEGASIAEPLLIGMHRNGGVKRTWVVVWSLRRMTEAHNTHYAPANYKHLLIPNNVCTKITNRRKGRWMSRDRRSMKAMTRRDDSGQYNTKRTRVTLISHLPQKYTRSPCECVFVQQYSPFHFRPISFHLILAQQLVIRNGHTLLCIQHLIWAEEIGKKRRKGESAERWEGQQMRGKRAGCGRGGWQRTNECLLEHR